MLIHSIKFIFEWAEKKLLLSIYKVAHLAYLDRNKLGSNWTNVNNYFEYSLKIADSFSNDQNPKSSIAIKAANGHHIKSLRFTIEFSSKTIAYQETIQAIHVKDKIILFELTNIPLLDVHLTENYFYFTFQEFRYEIHELILEDGESVTGISTFTKCPNYLSHSHFLNSDFHRKWGTVWNLDLYKYKALGSFQEKIWNLILGKNAGIIHYSPNGRGTIRNYCKIKIHYLITHRILMNRLMWTLLILRIITIDQSGTVRWIFEKSIQTNQTDQ